LIRQRGTAYMDDVLEAPWKHVELFLSTQGAMREKEELKIKPRKKMGSNGKDGSRYRKKIQYINNGQD